MTQPIAETIPLNSVRPSAPASARVVANELLTPGSTEEVRHVVLELPEDTQLPFLEGQCLGVIPPGLDAKGAPHRLRQYSIASDRAGEDGAGRQIGLCVKRVVYLDEAGAEMRGVASNHLADAALGDRVRVCGPFGKHFLLPADPTTPILMIATGTGIAPFRGFLRRRAVRGDSGDSILVFGVRTLADVLYGPELEDLLERPGHELALALSREAYSESMPPMRVGQRLTHLAPSLWPRLASGELHVFLCGIKGMEPGVEEALAAEALRHGVDWTEFRAELVKAGRWKVDTY